MSIVYVGLDLGSSNFQQVALNHAGVVRVNRDFSHRVRVTIANRSPYGPVRSL
jgi:hypothetical protein